LVDIRILSNAFLKILLADEAQLAIFNGDDRRRPRLPINDGKLACDFPGPKNGQDPLFALRRSYDDFEKALFEPVATVAGIPGSKKGVTGTEVTGFGARKQSSRQSLGQAGQYGLGG
jgi:hypothetical protein